ncbi:MAG: hypothetical protein M1835_006646 [Candelina submexicana]|nr:MAG: hypothetical protein M1835_006646 [Candelina submexicana]
MINTSGGEEERESLHVFDLPQLYTRPSSATLLHALALVAITPPSWDNGASSNPNRSSQVDEEGLARYLTTIISSPLQWIGDDNVKEKIWERASVRLSERSGRTAMPAMSRTFSIPTSVSFIDIVLHEPSLTADNLGLKTWGSSYLLAKRLHLLSVPESIMLQRPRVLELGSGTGLVGITAAAVWGLPVHLTDLPDIVPNLEHNVQENQGVITQTGGSATTAVLDWSDSGDFSDPQECAEEPLRNIGQFPIILAADPLYSPQHPQLLVQTIKKWLSIREDARVIVELPLRGAYTPEIKEFQEKMRVLGLMVIDQGEETGYDDWGGGVEGDLREVRCWWGVWAWANTSGLER